jgi:ATP-dependent helicase/nuclease subunit A
MKLTQNSIPKPRNVQWTDEQWQAITSSGENILVAAAAGSGKTAVLVERIIRKITSSSEIDVDQLLIVTFTNAAAAEMRKRIGIALEKAIRDNPASLHLRRQLSLLNKASISTLHAFCIEVLRKYYYQVNLDPNFRIADDTEIELIRQDVLDELFEEEYGKENNETFFNLVDRFSNDRGDDQLQKLILELFDFSRSHPWPLEWLTQMVEQYSIDMEADIDSLPWTNDLLHDIQGNLRSMLILIRQAKEVASAPNGPEPYLETLRQDEEIILSLINGDKDWGELYNKFQGLKFPNLKQSRSKEVDESLKNTTKSLRDAVKKQVEAIKNDFFELSPDSLTNHIAELSPVLSTLVNVVVEFSKRFQTVKYDKSLVDFSDLEHLALEVLKEQGSTFEKSIPSEVAIKYRNHFHEVLVDEYQDTNLVQETIIQLLTKSEEDAGNLFMVGDVKQSIYRFRLAEPTLFLQKYKAYKNNEVGKGLRIDLAKNFRSRKEVINSTNFLFKQVMNESVGEIDYDLDAELKLGASYPEHPNTVSELLLIDKADNDEEITDDETETDDLVELETVQLEARLMAKKVKEMIGQEDEATPYQVYDAKIGYRNIQYRDIVILLRATSTWAPTILEEFKLQGIPAYAELSSGYFDATEVSVMLSLLHVIDNPHQDIPLASVLRSPLIGLTGEDLAKVRILSKRGSYFDAMKTYINRGENQGLKEKLSFFYKQLQTWRDEARQGALSELLWKIFRETGYYDYVGGMNGGKQRQANLRALYDRSRQYETTSFRGLFRFLRFIERMRDKGKDLGTARALGEQEDVVRVMTIHKSKGLEFPVVFVAGLNKNFNRQDLNGSFLLHKELGFGPTFVNPTLRIKYPTLPMFAIKNKIKMELLAEEMRILYVALTRAKEKLYLIGTTPDLDKKIEKWSMQTYEKEFLLPDYNRSKAKCYLDWIGPAILRHRDGKKLRERIQYDGGVSSEVYQDPVQWNVSCYHANDFTAVEGQRTEVDQDRLDAVRNWIPIDVNGNISELESEFSWVYQHANATTHMSKQTVTEIKRQLETRDEYGDTGLIRQFRQPIGERPRFMQEKQLTAAERGTAMHMVMQHLDVQVIQSLNDIEEVIAKMVYQELLSNEQASAIDRDAIEQFLRTNLATRMKRAVKIHREVPFSLGLPGNDAYPNWDENNETVLLQGIIDCVIEEEDGLILLDYKTDSITNRFEGGIKSAESSLRKRYQIQLDLYEKALEQIWKVSCKEKYLYFFDGGHLIKV